MLEEWREVVGSNGHYLISNLGRVRRETYEVPHPVSGKLTMKAKTFKMPKPSKTTGYPVINLKINGKRRPYAIHRLVAEAFIGPPPIGHECAHGDGNRLNCNPDNLRWVTPQENNKDKEKHGTATKGARNMNAKLNDALIYMIRKDTRPQHEIAIAFGVCQSSISKILSRNIWKHI